MKNRKILLITSLLVWAILANSQSNKPETDPGTLRAAIAKTDITPEIPVKLYGYASRKDYSEGVHDPLSARVVAFENNGRRVVLISSDLGSYSRDVFPVIRKSIMDKYKLGESEIFISAIHSHSAPILSLDQENGDPNNVKYTQTLNQKLLDLVGEALAGMKPVRTAVGSGSSPVGVNRREMRADGSIVLGRNPYGPHDKEVLVMKIEDTDGNAMGALFDYATHATSLGPRNLRISGDVLGISAQFAEKILGNGMITPVFAGASADIDPWYRVLPEFNTENGWIPEPVMLGTLLGQEVVHVYRKIGAGSPGGAVRSSYATLECPRKKRPEQEATAAAQNQSPTVPVNITAARIGDDIAIIGFSVEMLTEVGMAIKAGSPCKHTFIITHCNGSSGYLPPKGLYKEGGYEVTTSNFEIGSAEMVVKKALTMLYDLK